MLYWEYIGLSVLNFVFSCGLITGVAGLLGSRMAEWIVNNKPEYKVIGIDKVDDHCILHQNEKFIGFCKKCLLNFCQKCEEENLHKDHEVAIFSEIVLDLTKKTIVKGCINLCH